MAKSLSILMASKIMFLQQLFSIVSLNERPHSITWEVVIGSRNHPLFVLPYLFYNMPISNSLCKIIINIL